MKRRRERESGATAIEFVVLTPLLFLLMIGTVQVGLALFARHVAISAAQEGARTAREQAAGTADWQGHATGTATTWVNQLLGELVSGGPTAAALAPVPVGDQNPQVGVSVRFQIATVVPAWTFTLSAQSVGPVECFYTPQGYCDGP